MQGRLSQNYEYLTYYNIVAPMPLCMLCMSEVMLMMYEIIITKVLLRVHKEALHSSKLKYSIVR